MTKEQLMNLGVAEDKVKEALKTIEREYAPVEKLQAVETENKQLQASIKERDQQLEKLKGAGGDKEVLEKQIAELQKENKAKEDAHKAEMEALRKDGAIEKALMGAGAKNLIAAKALLNSFMEKAELEGDTVKGLEEAIKGLVEGKDTGFMFESDKPAVTITGASPAGGSDALPDTAALSFENQLLQARNNGDNLTAIQIKQEAAAKGIILN